MKVLGRRSNHRWSTYVDLLYGVRERDIVAFNRFLEWIKIYDEHVDRPDAVRIHRFNMGWIFSNTEQTTMHPGVQRLDTTIHHLGKSSYVGNIDDLNTRVSKISRGSSGADYLDLEGCKASGKLNDAGFIRNAQ